MTFTEGRRLTQIFDETVFPLISLCFTRFILIPQGCLYPTDAKFPTLISQLYFTNHTGTIIRVLVSLALPLVDCV